MPAGGDRLRPLSTVRPNPGSLSPRRIVGAGSATVDGHGVVEGAEFTERIGVIIRRIGGNVKGRYAFAFGIVHELLDHGRASGARCANQ